MAFGIAALVFAIIGIFIPGGYFISGLSGILSFFSVEKGANLGISAIIINIVNILLLSPTLMIAISEKYRINKTHQSQGKKYLYILLLIQIAAIIFFTVKKYRKRNSEIE